MVIGKTFSSISKADIFDYYTEQEILAFVFPEIKELPCLICSPLRKDEHPSFYIYVTSSDRIRYKDYAFSDEKGGLLDLLCKYWGCRFDKCLDNIYSLVFAGRNVRPKPRQIRTFTQKEKDEMVKVQVKVRPWKDYDYEYWESYGVGRQWLRYAEVYPISHKIIIKRDTPDSKERQYIIPADRYAYCYVERKEGKVQLKIYQPLNDKGFKWWSKMDSSVISLWTKIPEYGDRVVICSSLKDSLCLSSQLHIPAICPQGEGYDMSDTAIGELKRRYKKVFICFDTDAPGRADAERLAEKTGFTNIVPDLGTEKDLSDFFKSLENKEDFKKLETLFH